MEKSNTDKAKTVDVSPEELAIMWRKLVVMKRFFSWVAALYFMLVFIASGKLLPEITVPLAKGGKLVLFFAFCVLAHTLVNTELTERWGKFLSFRSTSLWFFSFLFLITVAITTGFLSF